MPHAPPLQAVPKHGGNILTVYGSGFRVLGGHLRYTGCKAVVDGHLEAGDWGSSGASGDASGELGGDGGSGDSEAASVSEVTTAVANCTAPPLTESVNEGLQCLFDGFPAVHAYHMADAEREASSDPRVADKITCRVPPVTEADLARHGLKPDEPLVVCVEVTLNGDRLQATDNCVTLTYYDA